MNNRIESQAKEVAARAVSMADLKTKTITGVNMLIALYQKIGFYRNERAEDKILAKAEVLIKARGFTVTYEGATR